jgi:hypothetical protein
MLIYFALCVDANNHHQKDDPYHLAPEAFLAAQGHIGDIIHLTRQTVCDLIPLLEKIGVVAIARAPASSVLRKYKLLKIEKEVLRVKSAISKLSAQPTGVSAQPTGVSAQPTGVSAVTIAPTDTFQETNKNIKEKTIRKARERANRLRESRPGDGWQGARERALRVLGASESDKMGIWWERWQSDKELFGRMLDELASQVKERALRGQAPIENAGRYCTDIWKRWGGKIKSKHGKTR